MRIENLEVNVPEAAFNGRAGGAGSAYQFGNRARTRQQ